MLSATYTFALLEVPQVVYAWVKEKLLAAGYAANDVGGDDIDMHGIGLRVGAEGMPLSLDGQVRVTLTDHGHASLDSFVDAQESTGTPPVVYMLSRGGTHVFTLRDFMAIFGPDVDHCMPQLFEGDKIEYLGSE